MQLEFSAGGIVFKRGTTQNSTQNDAAIEILVCQHSQHHGWVFPKGLIGDTIENENKEDTAVREVEEETGVQAKILQPLTPIVYWYMWEKEKRKKTVYYYIMEFVRGDINKHDHEMEAVEFIAPDAVEKRLTYPSDKKVWKEAREVIQRIAYSR